jgi:hypothetical protein
LSDLERDYALDESWLKNSAFLAVRAFILLSALGGLFGWLDF